MYSSITEAIWTTPSWMRMTIRVAVIAVHVGSNSQALKAIFDHIIHPSRIDCRRVSRRNLPWRRPFSLPWTLHRAEVLNAGKTTSSENSSVRGPVGTFSGGNTCMTSFKRQSSFLFL